MDYTSICQHAYISKTKLWFKSFSMKLEENIMPIKKI